MAKKIFIGVDGGATKTDLIVEDESGTPLSQAKSGPSNVSVSCEVAYNSILHALKQALESCGLSINDKNLKIYAGLGLAGLEDEAAKNNFKSKLNLFDKYILESDAHTACIGAHSGNDGIILIAGTGSVSYAVIGNKSFRSGGWGFPQSDEGSGAWIGLQLVKRSLYYYDKRLPQSEIFDELFKMFENKVEKLIAWAAKAKSTHFAELAPIVIKYFKNNDIQALEIMKECARHLEDLIYNIDKRAGINSLKIALIGGISSYINPLLDDTIKKRLVMPVYSPAKGSIIMLRKYLSEEKN